MASNLTSRVNTFIKLDYADKTQPWLTDQGSLRYLLGVLGMLLPLLLIAVTWMHADRLEPLESISHYYYTRACSVFVIVVSLLAIFLLLYKGYDPIDFWISSAAGIFALLLVLFPTSTITDSCNVEKYSVTVLSKSEPREWFHYISAAIFLACLAYMSLFLFTRSSAAIRADMSKMKRKRNNVYVACGILMVVALLVVLLGLLEVIPEGTYDSWKLTFWMEVLALEAFGFSWLTKAEFWLGD